MADETEPEKEPGRVECMVSVTVEVEDLNDPDEPYNIIKGIMEAANFNEKDWEIEDSWTLENES